VLPLDDNRSDYKWSLQIDSAIRSMFPETDAVLYGSRDSFIPSYQGKFTTEAYPQVESHNATNLREEAAATPLNSDEFRSGVIYGIHKQRPVTYPTVDVVVIDGDNILLGRKPAENLFRFIGGFVDRTDKNWESAARRELHEETNLDCLDLHYVCSQAIDDWRYSREENGIMTTLFKTFVWDEMGQPKASDDIAEIKWFSITAFANDDFIKENIVPEHVTLMQTFVKKEFENRIKK
jgi:bifunctional NMN adenylyltransferase/nudix hydrolase